MSSRLVRVFLWTLFLLGVVSARGVTAGALKAPKAPAINPTVLRFDRTSYETDEPSILRLWDDSSNTSPNVAEQVDVTVYARLSGQSKTVKLLETNANSGLFQGYLQIGPNGLVVQEGDLIAAVAIIGEKGSYRITAALIKGGKATGSFTYRIEPKLIPAGMESTPLPDSEPLPIAAVQGPSGAIGFFGETQVVYSPVNEQLHAEFEERHGADLLATVPLPLPDDMDPFNQGTANYYLYRVDPSLFNLEELPYMMEMLGFQGEYVYSSEDAARLIGILVEEQLAGNAAGPHSLMQYQGAPISNEGPAAPFSPANRDIFTMSWFDDRDAPANRVRLGRALALLDIIDARQTRPQVPLAIVDGGFAGPSDYPGALAGLDNPDIGDDDGDGVMFNDVPQCDINALGLGDCSPGSAAGPNPLPCSGSGSCPWHGMQMFSTSAAEFNNGFPDPAPSTPDSSGAGSVGSGAHAATPIFQRVAMPYVLPAASGIIRSVNMGARVINLSSGFPCGMVLIDWCDPGQVGFFVGLLTPVLLGMCDTLRAFVPILGPIPCPELVFTLFSIPISAGVMRAAVVFAEANDVLVVAAAGNQMTIDGLGTFGPFSPATVKLIPCTMSDTLCAGEIVVDGGNIVRAPIHGFGPGVHIYAPSLPTTAIPPSLFGTDPGTGGAGTSGATAFISGLAAQVRSINPALNRSQVKQLIIDAGCHESDATLIAGGNCTPTPSSVTFHTNDAPGGYADALETIHRALAGVGGLPPGLASCSGGWDEVLSAADNALSAFPISLTPGEEDTLTVTLTGDLSAHQLPSDEDWFQFRLPAGFSNTSGRFTVTTAGPFGNLTIQVFEGPKESPVAISPVGISSVPLLVNDLQSDTDYFVKVTHAGAVTSDNCYGGASLRVTIARPAPGDMLEGNDEVDLARVLPTWQHVHWICATELRGQFPPPATLHRCPGVFDDGAAHRSAVDYWYMDINNLTISSVADVDFYRLTLPDYTDPAQGGHADIDPDPTVTEQLFECGDTIRQDSGLGNPNVRVRVYGKLTVQVVPMENTLVARPAAGATLGLYRRDGLAWLRDDAMGSPASPTMVKQIVCPQEELDLQELLFSIGEDDVPRASAFDTGGYSLHIGYQLVAERNIPEILDVFPGPVGPLACRSRDPGLGGSIFSFFPRCGYSLPLPFELWGTHPLNPGDLLECQDDSGRGCRELVTFEWGETITPFLIDIVAPDNMAFNLLDENLQVVAEGLPFGLPLNPGRQSSVEPAMLRLDAGQIPAGRYYLDVSGPPGEFDLTFMPPDEELIDTQYLYLPVVKR